MTDYQTTTNGADPLLGVLPNGSLEPKTTEVFGQAELAIKRSRRGLTGTIENPMLREVVFMRPQHIPLAVEQGQYDFGICGLDCIAESRSKVEVLAKLPYSRATSGSVKIVLVAANDSPIVTVGDVTDGMVVVSEYPNLTHDYFAGIGRKVEVRFSYGSTEALVPQFAPYGSMPH